MNIKNIVSFCILMENNKGILGKAPSYIWEKFESLIIQEAKMPLNFLDSKNLKKFIKW